MQKYIVYFDGVCNLCNGAVDFILKHREKDIYFCSLQSKKGQEVLKKTNQTPNMETIIFEKGGYLYTYSTAAIEISKLLKKPYSYLQVTAFIPRIFRDFVYKIISRYRYTSFGKRSTCRIPTAEEKAFFLD